MSFMGITLEAFIGMLIVGVVVGLAIWGVGFLFGVSDPKIRLPKPSFFIKIIPWILLPTVLWFAWYLVIPFIIACMLAKSCRF